MRILFKKRNSIKRAASSTVYAAALLGVNLMTSRSEGERSKKRLQWGGMRQDVVRRYAGGFSFNQVKSRNRKVLNFAEMWKQMQDGRFADSRALSEATR